MIKNAFIDGLNQLHSTITLSSRPKTLLEAFQVAQNSELASLRKVEKRTKTTGSTAQQKNNLRNKNVQNNFNQPNVSQPKLFQNTARPSSAVYRNPTQGDVSMRSKPSG
jgi:hypothetical protein